MPNYDSSQYDPPAPIAHVTLRTLDGKLLKEVILLLDTGADTTLLPRSAIARLNMTLDATLIYELIGFDGSRSTTQAVELDMIFLNKAYRGRYLLVDSDHGILGRDILANVVLSFDGPRQEWLPLLGSM